MLSQWVASQRNHGGQIVHSFKILLVLTVDANSHQVL